MDPTEHNTWLGNIDLPSSNPWSWRKQVLTTTWSWSNVNNITVSVVIINPLIAPPSQQTCVL